MWGFGKTVYKGSTFAVVEKDFMLPGGKKLTRFTYLKRRSSCVILAFKNNKLLLLKEYRPVVGRWVYQLPGGKVKKGESLVAGARRELEEETGYGVKSMKLMFFAWPLPSIIQQSSYFFVATLADKHKQKLDYDENIKVGFVSLDKAVHMIKNGSIKNLSCIAGILYYTSNHKNKEL